MISTPKRRHVLGPVSTLHWDCVHNPIHYVEKYKSYGKDFPGHFVNLSSSMFALGVYNSRGFASVATILYNIYLEGKNTSSHKSPTLVTLQLDTFSPYLLHFLILFEPLSFPAEPCKSYPDNLESYCVVGIKKVGVVVPG